MFWVDYHEHHHASLPVNHNKGSKNCTHFYNNLHDRLSTSPFLGQIDKKWLAFQASLLSILGMVLCPSLADESPNVKRLKYKVLQGVCYENTMLWCADSNPSHVTRTVTYMWQPFSTESSKLEDKEGDLSSSQTDNM